MPSVIHRYFTDSSDIFTPYGATARPQIRTAEGKTEVMRAFPSKPAALDTPGRNRTSVCGLGNRRAVRCTTSAEKPPMQDRRISFFQQEGRRLYTAQRLAPCCQGLHPTFHSFVCKTTKGKGRSRTAARFF